MAITETWELTDVTNKVLKTENNANGYIGLAPYTFNIEHKEFNFLWQLKHNGYIDDIVFAIFTDLDKTEGDIRPKSHLSLGAYDSSNYTLKDGQSMKWITSKDLNSWAISITSSNFVMDD